MEDTKNEITKPEKGETALATVTEEELALSFGGPNVKAPIEMALPEIKMTKTDDFKLANGTKVKELVGYMVFAQRSRSYWAKDYDGQNTPPDCASDDTIEPSQGEQMQCEKCINCKMAKWTEKEIDGKMRNVMPCGQSLNVILLLEGRDVPNVMRIRSTSIHPKSNLAAFFSDCLEKGFAYARKYGFVKIKLTLDEMKINGFETSTLVVEKIDTLTDGDPMIRNILNLNAEAIANFVVKHQRDDAAADDDTFAPEESPVEDMPFGDPPI